MMEYGDKRDYPRIDLFIRVEQIWVYAESTTWSRTCKEAKRIYVEKRHLFSEDVRAKKAFK